MILLCSSQVLWLKSGTCRIGYRNIVLFLFHYENISAGDFQNINICSLQLLPVTLWQHLLFCVIPVNMWHETITRLAYPSPSYSQPQRSVQILNDCICISDVYLCNRSLITLHQRSPLPNLLLNKECMWMFKSKFWFIFGIQIQTTYLLALGRKQRKWKNGGRRNDYFSTVLRKYRNEFLEHVK